MGLSCVCKIQLLFQDMLMKMAHDYGFFFIHTCFVGCHTRLMVRSLCFELGMQLIKVESGLCKMRKSTFPRLVKKRNCEIITVRKRKLLIL